MKLVFKIWRWVNKPINRLEIFFSREKLFSQPRYIQIEPTNRCNQRCLMCPRNHQLAGPLGDLPLADFKKIINRLPALEDLLLNGLGEPLLNPELPSMIAYAASRGIKTAINSNGALIDEPLAKKLMASGLGLLKISLDSADSAVYQSIRQASLAKTIEGIKAMVKVRQEHKSHLPQLWFNSIIMKSNYRELAGILKLGAELGIDLVRFKPINEFWLKSKSQESVIGPDDLIWAIKQAIAAGEGLPVKHNLAELLAKLAVGQYARPKSDWPCFSPWLELYIQYYGGVRLCCEFCLRQDDIGNLLAEDFQAVWNGSKMRQIRKEFAKGNTYFPACRNCNRFQRNVLIQQRINKLRKNYKK
ncbi:MAG: radical SAM protein [bacterium]